MNNLLDKPGHPRYVRFEHNGRSVVGRTDLVGKHRKHCLCYECTLGALLDGTPTICLTAKQLYELCKATGIMAPVYECPQFIPRDPKRPREEA